MRPPRASTPSSPNASRTSPRPPREQSPSFDRVTASYPPAIHAEETTGHHDHSGTIVHRTARRPPGPGDRRHGAGTFRGHGPGRSRC
ncbi:hypothetical protein ACFFX0_20920 [Citricoccus parietis]|uniref:Uncharacterized protein n=1 Tax=Citricoccus parietis TaxID=592307 RepID=A0ABV5G3N8_9MICC